MVSPYTIPDVAIIDPVLTLTVPPGVTAATGMDALSHAVEAYTSLNASPMTDLYALEAVRLIGTHLRTAVANGSDLAAREGMARASFYAGIAIGNAGTNIVHALAYPLQGQHRITHGVANSLLLPYGMEFNALSNLRSSPPWPRRWASRSPACRRGRPPPRARRPAGCSRWTWGFPSGCSEVGIRQEHIGALVEGAMKMTRLWANNPGRCAPRTPARSWRRRCNPGRMQTKYRSRPTGSWPDGRDPVHKVSANQRHDNGRKHLTGGWLRVFSTETSPSTPQRVPARLACDPARSKITSRITVPTDQFSAGSGA